MKSTITFISAKELAMFLAVFLPNSTAIFNVEQISGNYVLTFTGGF